ncbi:MAG: ABC transporter ATP-binding protein [Bacteroidetes bacterium]|uniref:ABC transporter ATP-binding protein n=1 Tax=Candidatus Limisoma faecipullorum TaxID=2840854 RepID=A0A9D9INV7_9BACT|nr:ABC transporter ATP-binding protein [Candidatus Limisoma faecipullorum]
MLIQTEKLTKKFRTSEVETIAVNNLDFEVEEGQFVAIMGPSGCGKTTLLNVLGLLDTPTSGKYILNGKDVTTLGERDRTYLRRGKIGFIFQSFNLIDELTVQENIELPLTYLKIKGDERKQRVLEIMRRMEISHRAKHFPHQLSGGQQQRVAIARAVVSNPDLILADEPTGNLDSKNGVEVMNILTELNKAGTTVVMVTHNQRDAGYAHRVIDMLDGEIISTVINKE